MVRPRHENPTPAELEVLQVIWDRGPSTVREVMEVLNKQRPRAYTSVMSLMNVMAKKGLLKQKPQGRAFVYSAKQSREKTRSKMLKELLGRTFGGSTKALMIQILQDTKADAEELEEIRKTIAEYEREMSK